MRKGFTLIELMVAVGLLAVVLSFAGVIFNVSIESHRMASANAEISQKLRAITDQFNADFGGIRTDAPLLIWFEHEAPADPEDDPNRYDQIMFFADGDFQSIQLYDRTPLVPWNTGAPIWGNTGRIHYGQARVEIRGSDGLPTQTTREPYRLSMLERILGRRQHILTAYVDTNSPAEWPRDVSDFDREIYPYLLNDVYEHDSFTLAKWTTVDGGEYSPKIIETCFDNRPLVGLDDPDTYHNLMCEGVGTFAIQWAYWDNDELSWYPADSDFTGNQFGVYFNVPGSITGWLDGLAGGNDYNIFPKALKFTFRLYDSRGLIKEDGRKGRVFTHIVYLAD